MESLRFFGLRSLCLILIVFPLSDGAVPGTFFWKPRLGIDLNIPTTEITVSVALPTVENIREGLVVLIDGYEAGLTIMALAAGIADSNPYPHLNLMRGYFYTNAYRWALRHLSMLPFWMGGRQGSYCDTHKVWKKRFFYMDEIMPKWLKAAFPYVKKEDWKKEEKDLRRYKKFSEYAFAKHYKYPSKKFNNFQSLETEETKEVGDSQSSSFLSSASYKGKK